MITTLEERCMTSKLSNSLRTLAADASWRISPPAIESIKLRKFNLRKKEEVRNVLINLLI
jgi:hypothetical protein